MSRRAKRIVQDGFQHADNRIVMRDQFLQFGDSIVAFNTVEGSLDEAARLSVALLTLFSGGPTPT